MSKCYYLYYNTIINTIITAIMKIKITNTNCQLITMIYSTIIILTTINYITHKILVILLKTLTTKNIQHPQNPQTLKTQIVLL